MFLLFQEIQETHRQGKFLLLNCLKSLLTLQDSVNMLYAIQYKMQVVSQFTESYTILYPFLSASFVPHFVMIATFI